MGNLTDINTLYQRMAEGYGFMSIHASVASGATTAAAAPSGHLSCSVVVNAIGTTLPGTLVGFPSNGSTNAKRLIHYLQGVGAAGTFQGYMGVYYKLGTLNLAATGDQFTHDAATFPVLRTKYGESSKPVSLIPLVQITTATTTTAPIFTLKNGAGTNGYVDEDGNTIVGTKTMTMPAAATANNSTFIFRLENDDNAVEDIVNINVGTAAATGAATIWGFEPISPLATYSATNATAEDALFAPLRLPDITPAVATSGTAKAYLGGLLFSNATRTMRSIAIGVDD